MRGVAVAFGVALIIASFTGNSQSADEAPLTEQDFLAEIPVVLSAARLSQPVSQAPVAVSIIDRDMIRASGFRQIADLLRLVPGFYVGQVNGNQPVVSYHGLSNEFSPGLQVLVDGRSVYTPLFGAVDWSDLPFALEDIERIEVVRGPNAASYGANSFLSVINIITRHAGQDRGGHASASIGEKRIRDGVLRYGGGIRDGLDYRLTAGYRADDGFDNVFDEQHVRFANLRVDYRATPTNTLLFEIGGTEAEREHGFFDCEATFDCARVQNIHNHFQLLRWQHSGNDDNEIAVQLFHNYGRNSEVLARSPLLLPQFDGTFIEFVADSAAVLDRYDAELQQTIGFGSRFRLVWGASARYDEVESPLFFNTAEALSSRLFRVFGHGEWRVTPKLLVQGGALFENNSFTGSDVSPRLAVNYLVLPQHSLRASISRALRTPTFFQEKADFKFEAGRFLLQPFLSSGGLEPERITSREIGYVGNLAAASLTLDLRLFRDDLDDLIRTTPRPFPPAVNGATTSFENGDSATIQGAEAQIRWRPWAGSQLLFNYAHIDVDSPNPNIERNSPSNIVSALATQRFPHAVYASIAYYQVSSRNPSFDRPFELAAPIPLSRRLDLRLAKRFKTAWSRDNEAAITLQNVLGGYQDFRPENIHDRRAFFTLSVAFE